MFRAIFSLSLIPLGIGLGWLLEKLLRQKAAPIPSLLQKIAIIGINPVAVAGSVWGLKLSNSDLAALPFAGLAALASGFLAGHVAGRLLKLGKDRGTVLTLSAGMTNMGSIGAIVAYILLGEGGFALIPFYKVFEEFWYYGICYPFAARAGTAQNALPGRSIKSLLALLKDPFLFMSLGAMALGLILNMSGLARPLFFKDLIGILVPAATFLLLVSVGIKIPRGKMKVPRPILAAFLAIRLIFLPVVSWGAAMALGLAGSSDPTALRLVILLSLMPTAFNSLIPPSLYGLDFGLSFGMWIISSLTLIGTIPLLWLVLPLF
jgi:hypothetical protein